MNDQIKIDKTQVDRIVLMLQALPSKQRDIFFARMEIEQVKDLPADQWKYANSLIEKLFFDISFHW